MLRLCRRLSLSDISNIDNVQALRLGGGHQRKGEKGQEGLAK